MNERYLPAPEQEKIAKLRFWRNGLALTGLLPMSVVVFSLLWRGESDWPVFIFAATMMLILLGLIAYVSFGMRCPRCATWIGIAVNRCASCGLKFEVRTRP